MKPRRGLTMTQHFAKGRRHERNLEAARKGKTPRRMGQRPGWKRELVERDAAGVLTEGRRRGPVVLKILGLRSRSWDREFDVRGADVEKPSSARNPKDKPVLLGVG